MKARCASRIQGIVTPSGTDPATSAWGSRDAWRPGGPLPEDGRRVAEGMEAVRGLGAASSGVWATPGASEQTSPPPGGSGFALPLTVLEVRLRIGEAQAARRAADAAWEQANPGDEARPEEFRLRILPGLQ